MEQELDEFREALRYMPHELSHSFPSVGFLFTQSSPDGEYGVNYSLDRVEVAGRLARSPSYPVLLKIDVQFPMHALYGPVRAHDGTQQRRVRRQARHIQPFLDSMLPS